MNHPARRARTATALVSAAAFAAIAGGLATTHAAASSTSNQTPGPAATAGSRVSGSGSDVGSGQVQGPDGTDWSGTPASSGSLTRQGPPHGRSSAS